MRIAILAAALAITAPAAAEQATPAKADAGLMSWRHILAESVTQRAVDVRLRRGSRVLWLKAECSDPKFCMVRGAVRAVSNTGDARRFKITARLLFKTLAKDERPRAGWIGLGEATLCGSLMDGKPCRTPHEYRRDRLRKAGRLVE